MAQISFKLFICLLSFFSFFSCQKRFQPGMIQLTNGSIYKGYVGKISEKSRFTFKTIDKKRKRIKCKKTNKVEKYTSKGDTLLYRLLKINGIPNLARIHTEGEISLCETRVFFQNYMGRTYSYQYFGVSIRDEPYIQLWMNGWFSNKENISFKEFAEKHMYNAPYLVKKIGTKGYEFKDRIKVFKEYNNFIKSAAFFNQEPSK